MKRNVKAKEKSNKSLDNEDSKSKEQPDASKETEKKSEPIQSVPFNLMKGLEKICEPRLIKDLGFQKSYMLKVNRASIFGYIQWNLNFPVPRNILTYVKTGIKADSEAISKTIFTLTSNPERLYKDGIQVDPTPIIIEGELVITVWSTTSNYRIAQGMDIAVINVMTIANLD